MSRKNLDSVLIFGNASDYGDLVYVSNFIPFGRAAIVVPREGDPTLVTDAILHGEPINSYAWMTWIHDFVPVPHDLARFAEVLNHILSDNKSKRVGVVGYDNIPITIWTNLTVRMELNG